MEKYILLFLSITGFIACRSTQTLNLVQRQEEFTSVKMPFKLEFLSNYSYHQDTLEDGVLILYDDIGIYCKTDTNGQISIVNRDEILFKGYKGINSYLYEVFADSFLLVTCVKGISSASTPDLFERKVVYLFDLESNIAKKVSMEDFRITRSEQFLNEYFPDTMVENNSNFQWAAVKAIDFKNNELVLVKSSKEQIMFHLKSVERPVME